LAGTRRSHWPPSACGRCSRPMGATPWRSIRATPACTTMG
jgi:hypothetical protein